MPEKENKFIPNSASIPHVILDMLMPRLPNAEARIILYIARRTYGFHKKEDRISFSQFINGIKDKDGKVLDYGTGLSRPVVSESLKNLMKAGAIFVRNSTKGNNYAINLDMDVDIVVKRVGELRSEGRGDRERKPKQAALFGSDKKADDVRPKELKSKKPSPHRQLILYWFDLVKKTRGIKILITGANCKNLKRVLDLDVASQQDLEKFFLYYLANPRFKTFAPDLSTCLSSGVMNTLLNVMKQDINFWKDLDNYSVQYLRTNFTDEDRARHSDLLDRLGKLKDKLSMTPKFNPVLQPA